MASAWAAATVGITFGALGAAAGLAPRSAHPGAALVLLVFVGSSMHVASTVWVARLSEVRDQARLHPGHFVWCPLLLIVATAGAASWLPPAALDRLLVPYFAWQLWHYQRQNVGFVALAARSTGVPGPTRAERKVLAVAGEASGSRHLLSPRYRRLPTRWR